MSKSSLASKWIWQWHGKAAFPGASITHGAVKKKFLPRDAFPCSFNFPRQRKWVNVIPFLVVERANLLTPSIVDWLGDGRAAGDKRKVQKERFIWLSPLPCSPALGETDGSGCWIILMSPLLHPSAFTHSLSLSGRLFLPGSALICCSRKFQHL